MKSNTTLKLHPPLTDAGTHTNKLISGGPYTTVTVVLMVHESVCPRAPLHCTSYTLSHHIYPDSSSPSFIFSPSCFPLNSFLLCYCRAIAVKSLKRHTCNIKDAAAHAHEKQPSLCSVKDENSSDWSAALSLCQQLLFFDVTMRGREREMEMAKGYEHSMTQRMLCRYCLFQSGSNS